MNKLLTFVLAAMAFVACTQNDVEELTANRADVPETLTVGFEGGDTRIELNNALKSVWSKGDEVSVFYRSYENLRYAYNGETGERMGELTHVSGNRGEQSMDNIIVVYPYNAEYLVNLGNGGVEASLPAVQSYKEGSYGAEGNIMVAESEFTQFVLKSVCGWLRVELTGEGESVKAITLRGNAGEQVAGLCYIDCTTATATLASAEPAEGGSLEVSGNIATEESILTEITLNCGSGVMLGAKAKSFYIGLLPQTFEEGITVEVECGNGTSTTKSTADKLVVERNHIVPMASFKYDGVVPEVYELAYTTNDGKALDPFTTEGFGGEFMENIYDAATGRGVLKFAGAVTTIPEQAFGLCENLTWIDIPEGITTVGKEAFTDCSALEEITIPASVMNVGNKAFKNCPCKATINCENVSFEGAGFTEVIIGDGVTTIGYRAFYNCDSLTSVTIPDSVTMIGQQAFSSCDSLTSVTIGDSVTTIGSEAFYSCDSLTSVTIGDSVTTIGDWAFSSCSGLTSVTIGDSVTTIGVQAFENCTSLTSVTIPDSVTTIGDYAFYNCSSLTSVTIGDNVTTIGYRAFYKCYDLTSVTIGDSVTTIGKGAFYDCNSLTSVTIPNSVTTIEEYAFYECESLTSVTIGDSVTTIGYYAFCGCDSLTSVYCEAITPPAGGGGLFGDPSATIYIPEGSLRAYKLAENWSKYADCFVEYDYNSTMTLSYTTSDGMPVDAYAPIVSNSYQNGVGELTYIGKDSIPTGLFRNRDNLTSVTIPDSVTSIGDYAFYGCDSLTSVTIPDSVTTIGARAFCSCDSLTSVTIGDSVTTIGDVAFAYCYSLTSVTIPDSVSTIGYQAFYGCDSLTSVTIGDSVTTIGEGAFYDCNSLTSVTIPDSVTTIGDEAFRNCSSLTSVVIPDSVTSIGNSAFYNCDSLTSVYITDVAAWCNISFGDSFSNPLWYAKALYLNNELVTDLTIPNSVTTIGDYAFYSCESLTSVTIPDSVRTIGEWAFASCDSLTSVTIGDSVTTIGEAAFYCCYSLTSVTIPDSVTTIGDSAFRGCDSLTSVTIPDSVTTIGSSAFDGCDSLTSVTIPDSVTAIGASAFLSCNSLTSVYCKATTPPTLGNSAFYNNSSGRKIYVPEGSLRAYKMAENWSDYANRIVEYDFETGEVVE